MNLNVGRLGRPGIGRGSSAGLSSKILQNECSAQSLRWSSMDLIRNSFIDITAKLSSEARIRIVKDKRSDMVQLIMTTDIDHLMHTIHLSLESGKISHAVLAKFSQEPRLNRSLPAVNARLVLSNQEDVFKVPAGIVNFKPEKPCTWFRTYPKLTSEDRTEYTNSMKMLMEWITKALKSYEKSATSLTVEEFIFLSILVDGTSKNLRALSS